MAGAGIAKSSGAVLTAFWVSGALAGDLPLPVDQHALNAMYAKEPLAAFQFAFDAGDELTEAAFTAERGVGANVGKGQRFTRYPRADLRGEGEWASHMPPREGGPQAQACITCHSVPYANGAGGLALNVAIDPLRTGNPALYLERNTLHLFGLGAPQRIAEEMTQALRATEARVGQRACREGTEASEALVAKGVSFGRIAASPGSGSSCAPLFDRSQVEGIDADLVVRPFGWKGQHATIRDFSRSAAHNELGMQAVELVGDADGDHDGVANELTVGDLTALTVYIAALERPISKTELADRGLLELSASERRAIDTGESRFADIGCAGCHRPTLEVDEPIFSEPSAVAGYHDEQLPSGVAPVEVGLLINEPMQFDLTRDSPNNHVELAGGNAANLGAYERSGDGKAVVRWYSDFKRHDMGPSLSDPIDAYGMGASVWPTRSLAGVGSTGPWLHHGHATTLDEAIRAHGGDAQPSRDAYAALSSGARDEVVAFLENLILVDLDPGEDE